MKPMDKSPATWRNWLAWGAVGLGLVLLFAVLAYLRDSGWLQ